jgi:serine protease Do
VLSPKESRRGQLLTQYVCVRITRMDEVDVALFDRDWNNTIYYFMLNADEQIYMRYGGRDSQSPDTYLNLSSLEVALEQGLDLHRRYQQGELPKVERPKPLFPREIPLLVERTFARNACVECHLIGDYRNVHREQDKTLDKLMHMYRSPDLKTLGIHLDVPKGLVLKEARDAALTAGMKPGDRIAALNGVPVWTFGDLQYQLDKVDRRAKETRLTVERDGKSIDLPLTLAPRWWWTDLRFRNWTIDPRLFFDARPLTEAEKTKHNLAVDGFASEVTHIDMFATMTNSHALKVGDIVFGVDGIERDEFANTADVFLKIHTTAGEKATLDVLRDGKRMKMPIKTYRMSFRK